MAGWQCRDRNTIEWDGIIKADSFIGDGSQLTGISSGFPSLDQITNPTTSKTFNFGNNKVLIFTSVDNTPVTDQGIFNFECTGDFTGNLVHIHQHNGNPGTSILLTLEAEDADVTLLEASGASISNNGSITTTQTASAANLYVGQVISNLTFKDNNSGSYGEDINIKINSQTDLSKYGNNLNINAGDIIGVLSNAGDLNLSAGTTTSGADIAEGGSIVIHGGNAQKGSIEITAGSANIAAGSYNGGNVEINSGEGCGGGYEGNINLYSSKGAINIETETGNIGLACYDGGNIDLGANMTFTNTGADRTIKTADILEATSDALYISTGDVTSELDAYNEAGDIIFNGGKCSSGANFNTGGLVTVTGAHQNSGGSIEFEAGSGEDNPGSNSDGGYITFSSGYADGSGTNGYIEFYPAGDFSIYNSTNIILDSLPTNDPAVAGALWASGAYLMISAG